MTSFSREILEEFRIPLEEIQLATKNFSSETLIREGKYSKVYKGILSKPWQYRTVSIKRFYLNTDNYRQLDRFANEVETVLSLNHPNIIPFVGYYHAHGREIIIVSEYAENGSLYHYLRDRNCRRPTWEERLKICLGAARGLEHLHSSLGDDVRVIHRDFKTANILLDTNLNAKVCGFDFSLSLDPKQPNVYEHAVGTLSYLDPVYYESGIVNIESDVYSFGVILFEMLSGMLRYNGDTIDDVHPQTLINLVRNCNDDGLDKLIDDSVRRDLNMDSFKVFKKIAYKCISLKLDERPTMRMIIKRLEEALDIIQKHGAASTNIITRRRQRYPQYRKSFLIPIAEIKLATEDFSLKSQITHPMARRSPFFVAYRGQLSEGWQNRKALFKRYNHDGSLVFHNELEMFHRFNHENIISFIGYCIHNVDNYYLVHQCSVNGSLRDHLYQDPNKKCCLTWAERLKICVGAARGLKYLHSGPGAHTRVIHGDVTSEIILLDDNLEAKISDFSSSKIENTNDPQVYRSVYWGTQFYRDPILIDGDMVRTESDVYSFGVVLFEVLTGMLAEDYRTIGDASPQGLVDLVRRYYDDGGLDNLIDPRIRDEISNDSFHVFKKIAYQCISLNPKGRPTMNRILSRIQEALDFQNNEADSTRNQQLESYLIPLKDIKSATNDFSRDNCRGVGGFGEVFKGQLSNRTVAIKRLINNEGYEEFDRELKFISNFRHANIIPFVGYCNEENHMIIVTEYATNHGLDHHLQDPTKRSCLTWAQRLKICLGAAKGLKYLHLHGVIHRDVKSGNILLDGNMEARICDFGLSKQNLKKDQQSTHIDINAAGTYCYLDPSYQESGILRSASDVYSFGVVLFEILSGTMAYSMISIADGKPQPPLMNLVRRCHDGQLEKLVDPSIADQIDSRCFLTFKELAYKCVSQTTEARPTMDIIVETIEDAIDFQALRIAKRDKRLET